MTVEQIVELLQRAYPQAVVMIEVTGDNFLTSWDPLDDCALLNPYDVKAAPRGGPVHILCDQHDC